MGAALAAGADCLVTSGRRWSNHARLTAAAGAKAGLPVHLVLSGPRTEPSNPGVGLAELLGATVQQARTSDRVERETLTHRVVEELRSSGRRPYLIGVGGSGVIGAVGQVLGGIELAEGAATAGLKVDDVVLPTATGGTQAGLLVGLRTAGVATRVLGIAVAHPSDELRPAISATIGELGKLDGLANVDAGEIELQDDQLGPGYGRRTVAADAAAGLLARTEGILVDPIYTAKALAGLIDLCHAGLLDGRRVVFWHAGGTPGLFEPLD